MKGTAILLIVAFAYFFLQLHLLPKETDREERKRIAQRPGIFDSVSTTAVC
jgi:hypothetical protein